jgi:hypothetical protein
MLPTGFPLFVRLRRLMVLMENTREYGRCTGSLVGGCGAPLPASVVRGAPGGGVLGSIALPNLIVLLTFRLSVS